MITTINLNDSINNEIEKIVFEYKQKNSHRLSKSAFINLAIKKLIEDIDREDYVKLNELFNKHN